MNIFRGRNGLGLKKPLGCIIRGKGNMREFARQAAILAALALAVSGCAQQGTEGRSSLRAKS
jgi:hypothetical protein